jgi:hypothetical protein
MGIAAKEWGRTEILDDDGIVTTGSSEDHLNRLGSGINAGDAVQRQHCRSRCRGCSHGHRAGHVTIKLKQPPTPIGNVPVGEKIA